MKRAAAATTATLATPPPPPPTLTITTATAVTNALLSLYRYASRASFFLVVCCGL